MTEILRWWRDNPNKKQIMYDNGIKTIIYADIKRLYLEGRK